MVAQSAKNRQIWSHCNQKTVKWSTHTKQPNPILTCLSDPLNEVSQIKKQQIVQWICLRLPSCGPGFEPQAHHKRFYTFSYFVVLYLSLYWKRTKINKEAGFGPYLKKQWSFLIYLEVSKKYTYIPKQLSNLSWNQIRYIK